MPAVLGKDRDDRVSARTRNLYRKAARKFAKAMGNPPLRAITGQTLATYRDLLKASIGRGKRKRLRKTSGSLVEHERPGTGHRHLGHGRAIFERHYEVKRLTRCDPTVVPPIVADAEQAVEVDPAMGWL